MSNSTLTEVRVVLLREKNRESKQGITCLKRDKALSMKLVFLPVVLFSRQPIAWLKRFYLSWRHRSLIEHFKIHSQRFRQFRAAISALKEGNYEPAIRALNFLIQKTPASFAIESTSSDNSYTTEEPNPIFYGLIDMRNELVKLQSTKQRSIGNG